MIHSIIILGQSNMGGLGDYLQYCERLEQFKNYIHVNAALRRVAEKMPMTSYVPAEGLGTNPDNLHFSAVALREFGVRYYNKFVKIEDKNKAFAQRATFDDAIKTEIEHL